MEQLGAVDVGQADGTWRCEMYRDARAGEYVIDVRGRRLRFSEKALGRESHRLVEEFLREALKHELT